MVIGTLVTPRADASSSTRSRSRSGPPKNVPPVSTRKSKVATSSKRDSIVTCAPSVGATVIACNMPVTDANGLIMKMLSPAVRPASSMKLRVRDQHRVQGVDDPFRPRRGARGEDDHRGLVGIAGRRGPARHRRCVTDDLDRKPVRFSGVGSGVSIGVGEQRRWCEHEARPGHGHDVAHLRGPGAGGRDHHQGAEPQRRMDGDRRRDVVAREHEQRVARVGALRPERGDGPVDRGVELGVGQRASPLRDGHPVRRAACRVADQVDRIGAPVPAVAEPWRARRHARRRVAGQVVVAPHVGAPVSPRGSRSRVAAPDTERHVTVSAA